MISEVEIRETALKYALLNAIKHGGKADLKAVMAKVMGEKRELRSIARQVKEIVEQVVEYVNSLSIDEQRKILQERWPELLEERRTEVRKDLETLPPLPNADKANIITLRFAPNPDFALTLGNARAAIINYAYKLKYESLGKKTRLILRFEDTDPKIKKPMLEPFDAYELIREDLRWLGIRWDEEHIQSERVRAGVYYDVARRLIEAGYAYVCTCSEEEWKKRVREARPEERRPCPCRSRSPEENLELFEKMLKGEFDEGQAVVRVKTDLTYPDPSVVDWVALRIVNPRRNPHPRILKLYGENEAEKYWVWPTYNFAVAVDDHLMGVTHILRAQEHFVNTIKQSFIYKYMGWTQPEVVHFGRLIIEGLTLSKSRLRGLNLRPDDPRLPTLAGLRERGILPETIWEIMLQVGVKSSDAKLTLENIYSINRKHLEPRANRYMAVIDPVELVVTGVDRDIIKVELPYHPSFPERGKREIILETHNGELRLYISKQDVELLEKNKVVRLMELANVEFIHFDSQRRIITRLHSYDLATARSLKAQIIQWVPYDNNVKIAVERPDLTDIREEVMVREIGLGEPELRRVKPGEYIQLMRYGFVKVLEASSQEVTLRYIHS